MEAKQRDQSNLATGRLIRSSDRRCHGVTPLLVGFPSARIPQGKLDGWTDAHKTPMTARAATRQV
jgi:hypothetical protein